MGVQVRGDVQEVHRRAEGTGRLPSRDRRHLSLAQFGWREGFVGSSWLSQLPVLYACWGTLMGEGLVDGPLALTPVLTSCDNPNTYTPFSTLVMRAELY